MGPSDSFVVTKFISLQNGKNKKQNTSYMIQIQVMCWPRTWNRKEKHEIRKLKLVILLQFHNQMSTLRLAKKNENTEHTFSPPLYYVVSCMRKQFMESKL